MRLSDVQIEEVDMRRHKLVRFGSGDFGTMGRLEQFSMLEEQNLKNAPNISCIPVGDYFVRRIISPHFGETFEVCGVKGRTHILFHSGNTEEDTEGCILVGNRFGVLSVVDEDTKKTTSKIAVLNSRAAFSQFMDYFEGVDEWLLGVSEF